MKNICVFTPLPRSEFLMKLKTSVSPSSCTIDHIITSHPEAVDKYILSNKVYDAYYVVNDLTTFIKFSVDMTKTTFVSDGGEVCLGYHDKLLECAGGVFLSNLKYVLGGGIKVLNESDKRDMTRFYDGYLGEKDIDIISFQN